MSKQRKRRAGAVSYHFKLYGCGDYLFEVDGKTYAYEALIMKRAKQISGYEQPVFSLYRDLHNCVSAREVRGLRAICIEDFNAEGKCCRIEMLRSKGIDAIL